MQALTKRCTELIREQKKNSSNSHKPPSSYNPGERRSIRKPKKRSGKKRGGQPGHKGSHRKLLAPELVDKFIDVFPDRSEVCQQTPPPNTRASPIASRLLTFLEATAAATLLNIASMK